MSQNGKQTVLLAEDDLPSSKFLSGVLAKNGFRVLTAHNGARAIELYMDNRYSVDAIVSDLHMPDVDGVKFAEFNYNNKALPFVVNTTVSDASIAMSLLKYGVQDYIEKPTGEKKLISVLKHSIYRFMFRYHEALGDHYDGNVASVKVSSRSTELYIALDWIRGKVWDVLDKKDAGRLLNFVNEFLLNAHEHGNMGIGEMEKTRLIENGEFENEVKSRERTAQKHIDVGITVLKNEIAMTIADEGKGFDYDKYLNMTEDELLERLEMPNGRGVYMSKSYFDHIKYQNGGASVTLVKLIR